MIKIEDIIWIVLLWRLFHVRQTGANGTPPYIDIEPSASMKRSVGANLTINATLMHNTGFLTVSWNYSFFNGSEVTISEIDGTVVRQENFQDRMKFIACENCAVNMMSTIPMSLEIRTTSDDITSSIAIRINKGEVINSSEVKLNVTYCESLKSTGPALKISGGLEAGFGDNATYTCTRSPASIVVGKEDFKSEYVRECLASADWTGETDVQCWYPPEPNITVFSPSDKYYENMSITLQCGGELGYPNASSTTYSIVYLNQSQSNVDETLTLSRYYNGANVSCRFENEYTKKFGSNSSTPITIEVLFAPHTDVTTKDEFPASDTRFTFNYTFSSNPLVHQQNLTLTYTGLNETLTIPWQNLTFVVPDNKYETIQTCRYVISSVSDESYGSYVLVAKSTDDKFKELTMTINLINPDTVTTIAAQTDTSIPSSPVPLPAIIGGSVAGLLVVILIIVYIIFKVKRNGNKTKGGEFKEDKENPLYGTSGFGSYPVNKPDDAGSSKEERLNPLYDSNSATQGGVEEAYAAVDVRKKKKNKANKGTENAAFSSESTAAVYAAVDKSKKKKIDKTPVEAVYSEVNKKKGSKNDTSLHGSSQ